MDGGDGNDQIYGGNQDDSLTGNLGNDVIYGDAGNDTLVGGLNDDQMYGGDGNDTFLVDGTTGWDAFTGGVGTDSILLPVISQYAIWGEIKISFLSGIERIANLQATPVDIIANGSLDLSAVEVDGIRQIVGSAGNDAITGTSLSTSSSLNDVIDGKEGNDTLSGGNGNDTLLGGTGAGADRLIGGAGSDSLTGGAGVATHSCLDRTRAVTELLILPTAASLSTSA